MKHALKRKLIQIAAFGYSNPYLMNYKGGKLYQGKWNSSVIPDSIVILARRLQWHARLAHCSP